MLLHGNLLYAEVLFQRIPLLVERSCAMVLKTLLLAWNSDGRGWTPIPERRLFCLDHALEARRLLEQA